jgi:hypothetical protein
VVHAGWLVVAEQSHRRDMRSPAQEPLPDIAQSLRGEGIRGVETDCDGQLTLSVLKLVQFPEGATGE